MRSEPNELTAIIEQKEGRSYVLRFADGQELRIPVHTVSTAARVGETLYLRPLTEKQAQHDKSELARSLLEELLNGGSADS